MSGCRPPSLMPVSEGAAEASCLLRSSLISSSVLSPSSEGSSSSLPSMSLFKAHSHLWIHFDVSDIASACSKCPSADCLCKVHQSQRKRPQEQRPVQGKVLPVP